MRVARSQANATLQNRHRRVPHYASLHAGYGSSFPGFINPNGSSTVGWVLTHHLPDRSRIMMGQDPSYGVILRQPPVQFA